MTPSFGRHAPLVRLVTLLVAVLGAWLPTRPASGDGALSGVTIHSAATISTSASAPAGFPAHMDAFGEAIAPQGFNGLCMRYPWACSTGPVANKLSDEETLLLARRVNLDVNHSTRPQEDSASHGMNEYWALPRNGFGDCEDYALLKMMRLIKSGVQHSALLLATAFNERDEHHVVLVLRTSAADLVLDNLVDDIRTWQATRYTFVKMQNETRKERWDAILLGPRASRGPVASSSRRPMRSVSGTSQ